MTPEQIAELEKRMKPDYYKIRRVKLYFHEGDNKYYDEPAIHQRMKDPLWLQAFREYNEANPDNKLGLGCSPCYSKVLMWHKRKLINQ